MTMLAFINTSRAKMIQDDIAMDVVTTYDAEGRQQSLEVTDTGAKKLDVSKAKSLIWMVMNGITAADDAMYNKGMLAIEYTMKWQSETNFYGTVYPGPVGSFPAQQYGDASKSHKIHNKIIFLGKAVRAIELALEAGKTTYVGAGGTTPITHLIDLLEITSTWMMPSDDLFKFTKPGNTNTTNQLMSVVNFIHGCGDLLSDATMMTYAENLLTDIIDNRTLPGSTGLIFPEKQEGTQFDTGYQTVSLHEGMDVWYRLAAGTYRDYVKTAMIDGWAKFLNYVVQPPAADAGRIITTDNTRTEALGDRVPPL